MLSLPFLAFLISLPISLTGEQKHSIQVSLLFAVWLIDLTLDAVVFPGLTGLFIHKPAQFLFVQISFLIAPESSFTATGF